MVIPGIRNPVIKGKYYNNVRTLSERSWPGRFSDMVLALELVIF
jgi:hypothetical protein